jgi:hypothetical protein
MEWLNGTVTISEETKIGKKEIVLEISTFRIIEHLEHPRQRWNRR